MDVYLVDLQIKSYNNNRTKARKNASIKARFITALIPKELGDYRAHMTVSRNYGRALVLLTNRFAKIDAANVHGKRVRTSRTFTKNDFGYFSPI